MNLKVNKVKDKVTNTLKEQKRIYIMIIILMSVGIMGGVIYAIILNKSDHNLVSESLTSFFINIKNNDINYKKAILNSLIGNISFTFLIFLLGISIIGMPLILLLLIFKSFIFGFSFSSIIYTYHFKGILKAIMYTFPHQWIILLISLFLGFYAFYYSLKLFNYLFRGKDINLKHSMKRYLQVFIITIIINILCSFLEVFLSPILLKLVI